MYRLFLGAFGAVAGLSLGAALVATIVSIKDGGRFEPIIPLGWLAASISALAFTAILHDLRLARQSLEQSKELFEQTQKQFELSERQFKLSAEQFRFLSIPIKIDIEFEKSTDAGVYRIIAQPTEGAGTLTELNIEIASEDVAGPGVFFFLTHEGSRVEYREGLWHHFTDNVSGLHKKDAHFQGLIISHPNPVDVGNLMVRPAQTIRIKYVSWGAGWTSEEREIFLD